MKSYLRLISTGTAGVRCDVTPLFGDYTAFSALVNDIGSHFDAGTFGLVAGIDALGFILGAALAIRAEKGFVPIRKGGKLPVEVDTTWFVDYTGLRKSLELRKGAIEPGTRVLVVDEWIETGAQVEAAISLITGQEGVIAGVATINMDDNAFTRPIRAKYDCYSASDES